MSVSHDLCPPLQCFPGLPQLCPPLGMLLHPNSKFGDHLVGLVLPYPYCPKAHRDVQVLLGFAKILQGPPPSVHAAWINKLLVKSGMLPMTVEDLDLVLRALGHNEGDIPAINHHLHNMMDITICTNRDHMLWKGAKLEDLDDMHDISLFYIPDPLIAVCIFLGDTHPHD
ncbi:hypothetical protein B0H10DRAFT_1950600 [Mycena sp. CBHHK59/15]|nr:hypothetical protein B0H10DRAFT_1950600 [Mycena sp. CBHHK59/15]